MVRATRIKMSSKEKGPADTFVFYQELTKLQQNQDYEKCLKLCNKILGVDGQDSTAFHCKIVSLMQLSKFDDALKQIRTSHLAEKVDVKFEEAYCLYRKNQLLDALKVEISSFCLRFSASGYFHLVWAIFTTCGKIYPLKGKTKRVPFHTASDCNFGGNGSAMVLVEFLYYFSS